MEELLADNNLYFTKSELKNRCVISNVKLKKGTIIINSPAMGVVLMEDARDKYCHTCLSLLKGHKSRCSRCKVAHYCSKECQMKAWKNGHKFACKLWKEKKFIENDLMDIDLLIQVALKTVKRKAKEKGEKNENENENENKNKNNNKNENKLNFTNHYEKSTSINESNSMAPDKIKDISESKDSLISWEEKEEEINRETFITLMAHRDEVEFDEWKYLRKLAKAVYSVAPELENQITESDLIQDLLRFKCNNFVCHDTQLFGIAEAVFPIGALFNHSCCPNATLYYHGNRQIIRAIRDIQPGEEVCITYTDIMNARKDRKKLLFQKYKFYCQCDRCSDNHGVDEKLIPYENHKVKVKANNTNQKEKTNNKEEQETKEQEKIKMEYDFITSQLNQEIFSLHDLLDTKKCSELLSEQVTLLESYPLFKFIIIIVGSLFPLIEESDETYYLTHKKVVKAIEPLKLDLFTQICKYTYHCIDENSYVQASYAALFVLTAYLVFLDRHHPLTGLQWMTLGKLVWNIGDDYKKEALYLLQFAKNSIMISEGRSDVLDEIENLIKTIS